jgi:hypothetical protein
MPIYRKTIANTQSSDLRSSRPFFVTLLVVEVLILSALNGFRSLEAFRYWQFLSSLSMSISPAYLAISGLLWVLIGIALSWILWRGQPGAPHVLRVFAVVYVLYYWIDRWLLTVSILSARWPFALLMTIFGLVLPFVMGTRPKVSAFFAHRVQ